MKENEVTSYVWKDSTQASELLKLSKRFEQLRILEENDTDTICYIMADGEERFLHEFELGNELITALLSERFEWPSSNTKTSYYILYEDDLNLVDIDFFTGKTSKHSAENELKNWKSKSKLRFALEIWESIYANTKIVSFWRYIQVIIQLFVAMIIMVFLSLFKESEEQKFKRRFHIKLSIIVYSIFLIIGLVWINFVQRPESWKDLGKFFGFLLFGTWLGTRFLKLVLLKK